MIDPRGTLYKGYMLTVLSVILASNYVDRLMLGLLLQDIKLDLALSDTQLGFLTGIAFAFFYSIVGIPIARWADRGNRITIITLTTALWSVAVALCGVAGNFMQLLLIRVGVAVGEAGCIPPAHSLIASYFSRAERPRAVGLYMLGAPLSGVIGYFLAGWLNEIYGWRTTFMIVGLPGAALALLAWLTLREPRRERAAAGSEGDIIVSSPLRYRSATPAPVQPSLSEVLRTLWANVTFRHLLLCFSIACFFGIGISQWKPAFFIRSFGLQTGEVGMWFALVNGVGGLLGTYWGGTLASRWAPNNERLQLKVMSLGYCSFGVISACIYVSPNAYAAFGFMALSILGISLVNGPLFATIQTLVPDRMRAMSIALVYLFANLVGMGFGPLAVGALSDLLRPSFGEESLRYALLTLCPGFLLCAWYTWRASATVSRDLEAARRYRAGEPCDEVEHSEVRAPMRKAIL